MAAETGLLIDGQIYEMPDPSSFTIDECQVLYDYSGLTIEDFVPLDGETDEEHDDRLDQMMRNPGVKKTLLHVAYQRGNPKVPASRVKYLVGNANWIAPFETLPDIEKDEEPDVPLASTSEPSEASPRSSLENDDSPAPTNETNGNGSPTDGSEPADTQPGTGVLRSVTSPTSPPKTSVA